MRASVSVTRSGVCVYSGDVYRTVTLGVMETVGVLIDRGCAYSCWCILAVVCTRGGEWV